MEDRGKIASHLMFPQCNFTNPEITTQFNLVKDFNSNRVNDLLIHNTIPTTLCDNLLSFRDTGKEFDLKGDLSKMITDENKMLILLGYRRKNFFMISQRK